MKILDRYIVKELLGPFLSGMVSFLAILVAGFILPKMVELLTGPHPIGLREAGLIFLYRLPSVAVMTFPMSTLLGALQGFGRLSGDSEVIVMHAGGISFWRMMRWVLAMGVVLSLCTFWFNETLVPAGNTRAFAIMRAADSDSQPTSALVVQDWDDTVLRRVVIARSFDIRTSVLHDVAMLEYKDKRVAAVTNAKAARYLKDKSKWEFENGSIQQIAAKGRLVRVDFDHQILEFTKSPSEVQLTLRKAEELTYEELRQYVKAMQLQGANVRPYLVSLQQKLSLPMASLVFILIGAPLGLRPHRGGSALGFGLAIMIAFFYYVVAHFLAATGEGGGISPAMAAWLPDIIGAVFAGVLIVRASR